MAQGEFTVPPSTAWHSEQLQTSHALQTCLSPHTPAGLPMHQGCICKRPAWAVSWTCWKRTQKRGVKHRSAVLFRVPKQLSKMILLLRSRGMYVLPPSPHLLTSSSNTQQYPRNSKVRQCSWCPISSSSISQRRLQDQRAHTTIVQSTSSRRFLTSGPESGTCLCI